MVDRRNERLAGRTGLHLSGPDHDQVLASAALVDRRLAVAQGEVAGHWRAFDFLPGDAAVIAGEEDDRVVGQAQLVDGVQHPPHAGVHRLDHGSHDRVALRVGRVGLLGVLLTQFRLVAVVRRMDRKHPVVQEEGLVFVGLQPVDGRFGTQVVDVLARGCSGKMGALKGEK